MRVVDPKVAYSMLHREQAQSLSSSSAVVSAALHQQQGFQVQQTQFQPQPPQFNMPPPPVMAASGQFHSFPSSNNMGMPPPLMQQQHPGFPPKQPTIPISASQQVFS